jgi:cytochrome c-type biogenesis protein CcmH/NrfF
MRRPRRLCLLGALLVTLAGSGLFVSSAGADLGYLSVVTQFMCTTCHEPLQQVNSPQAISEKSFLRGLIAKDLTLGQIKTAMEDQYGPEVLARPPASGFNLTIYILPPVVLIGGLALLAYTLPKWRERSRKAADVKLPTAEPLESADAKRLDDELTNFI